MTIAERDLVRAIEATLHFYPPVPGLSDDLDVPGVHGRVTALSHPLANLVGMAHLTERNADAVIAAVRERYGAGKAFGWIMGPGTTPDDLPARLQRTGLAHASSIARMSLTDLASPIRGNPSVRVEEVAPADAIREADMMGRAYELPTDVAAFFVRLLGQKGAIRSRGYFAYLDGNAPVAWSFLVYIPGTRIVLLGGAATLPEARRNGIYTALVKRRLDDARADGAEAAIIQADRDTSAPICAKLGFRELCGLELYVWTPS